ncbi:MAG: bifunctional UDP-N-acetylglucosamine diphosphorylase/glucosamine-1-phosphate N-acetyltransferase GlmU, partial [Candidatus Sericytochromatia bacterium]|nr:bifunctional UDP-N-acetylglucosamine diphosphorylase/glucosamine-1-phosphate N-acetyltransferase GlmU [Candidatus Sericytochromatia bacterium]
GKNKHKTIIGSDVFVGSNSTLVAPLKLESSAYIAAGSVITQTVHTHALGVGRARQTNIENWVLRKKGEIND